MRYPNLQWTARGQATLRDGWLVTEDQEGLAMVTERAATPIHGDGISILVSAGLARRFRTARITSVEALSTALDLVTAVFTPPAHAPARRPQSFLAYRAGPIAGEV